MIFTSNYARQGQNPLAISISVGPPKWFTGKHLPLLGPTWDMVKASKRGDLSQEEYSVQYLALLKERGIDPNTVLDFPDGTMLLCYETPTDFCHRHLLAEWVYRKAGILIPEWKNTKEQKEAERLEFVDSAIEF